MIRISTTSVAALLFLAATTALVGGTGRGELAGKAIGAEAADKPYGIERRIPLTTSRVVGSPDPAPPFRSVRAFPNLKLNLPIAVVRQPGAELLWLIQQPKSGAPAVICRVADQPDASEFETLLTLHDAAYDIVFHPKFAENGYVYIGCNGASSPAEGSDKPGPKMTRVVRYTVDRKAPFAVDANSRTTIIEWASDGHNGGAITFGHDGMMYVTSGDGTSDSDTNLKGQGLDHLLAKVLRIDVDHHEPDKTYSVPKDNPFVDRPGARPETWAYGLRNPWRMTTDAKTGHIWVGNNGQDLWEQVYFVRKGDNYGWSVMEGGHPFYLNREAGPTPFVKPASEHHHSEARSLTGGVVYYGEKFPELRGAYIYGDYSTGKIWAVRHDGRELTSRREIADTPLAITGFGLDSRGELLICDHRGNEEGAFYTLETIPPGPPTPPFPRKLSETGLFKSVAGHVVEPALVPYSVNSPLWSDGAHKERYIALPGADSQIDMSGNRGWNFPNGAVLVKSFALDMVAGDAKSRRWIETRLMVRQDNEWVGYSYEWNAEQTDATLVESPGVDREFKLRDGAGERKLAWHYPSRAECMVCHSRAANYVLGLSTAQMNKEHDYGGVKDNQLRTLAHIGMVKPLAQPLEKYAKMADPYDATAPLESRVRAYLHANCSHCHVEAGGGNAQMSLDYSTPLDKTKLIGVKPLHHSLDVADPRIVEPGQPDRSVLLRRISRRGPNQMPPLASNVLDEPAVKLLRDWIESLK